MTDEKPAVSPPDEYAGVEKEAPMSLLLHCGGPASRGPGQRQIRCQETLEITIAELSVHPLDRLRRAEAWTHSIDMVGWFVTSTTPPGAGRIVFDILCPTCAPQVLPRELYNEFMRIKSLRKTT